MFKFRSKFIDGYTMIEMIIAISIIVVIATLLFANYSGINKKGEEI